MYSAMTDVLPVWRWERVTTPTISIRAPLDRRRAHPAVDLQPDRAAVAGQQFPRPAQFRQHQIQERLAAETGLDRHQQQHVDLRQQVGIGLDRGGRVDAEPGPGTSRPDLPQQPHRRLRGFRMHGDVAGPGLGVGGSPAVRVLDHQMAVQWQAGVLDQRFHHRQANRQVRHEVVVHDVDVQPVGFTGDGTGLVGEPGEIGGQDARRQLDGHTGECKRQPAARVGGGTGEPALPPGRCWHRAGPGNR